jgi:hypothetical protein
MSTDKNGELWTYSRIRRRLNLLIEIMPTAAGDEKVRQNIVEDLEEIRACLDDWNREGVLHERK